MKKIIKNTWLYKIIWTLAITSFISWLSINELNNKVQNNQDKTRKINPNQYFKQISLSPLLFTHWINKPGNFNVSGEIIHICSYPGTDFFIDPSSSYKKVNAPLCYFEPSENFTITCYIEPAFKTKYDAGTIILYQNDSVWVKFAFEMTDLGYPSVVSVVTNEVSDDCNGEKVTTNYIYLKLAKNKDLVGLYYSEDKKNWKMVRLFEFKKQGNNSFKVGISAQSPAGNGCSVKFKEFNYSDTAIKNFRKGI